MIEIDRFNWNLARVFLTITSSCSILGIVCNSIIVLTTIKTKTLRSSCNILIALCAIGDVMHQVGTLSQSPLIFDIYIEMDSDLCLLIMFLPEMGIAIGCATLMSIGLDRMISVKMPTQYKSIDKRYFVLLFGTIISGYCAYFCFLMAYFRNHSQVVCAILTPYQGRSIELFLRVNISANIISTVIYVITWLEIRKQADPSMMQKIMKSLLIIVAVDVTGWFLTPGSIQCLHLLGLTPQQIFAWIHVCALFINAAMAAKLFIYYFTRRAIVVVFCIGGVIRENIMQDCICSTEYRAAIRGFLFKNNLSMKNHHSITTTI